MKEGSSRNSQKVQSLKGSVELSPHQKQLSNGVGDYNTAQDCYNRVSLASNDHGGVNRKSRKARQQDKLKRRDSDNPASSASQSFKKYNIPKVELAGSFQDEA